MKLKKITGIVCAFAVAAGAVFPAGAAAAAAPAASALNWQSRYVQFADTGYGMRFQPVDKYVSQQNPTSFTWPYVNDALGYDFKICNDKELKDIVYSKNMLPNNSHLPETRLETGVNYYWSVRYQMQNGTSEWSEARRFRIDPDAYEVTIESTDEIMKRVPSGHPRVGLRPENLAELRAIKDKDEHTKALYDKIMATAQGHLEKGVLEDDITEGNISSSAAGTSSAVASIQRTYQVNDIARGMSYQLDACAFAYLISGDEELGQWAKKVLLKLAEWDPHGITDANKEAQANRQIAASSARGYDWLYNILTPDERTKVLTMLKERTDPMAVNAYDLRKAPYGSFPNTVFTYAGVVAYATCGEIEGYDTLLRDSIELARTALPNWSYEDGGWSEGTSYWRGQTVSKAFYDLLAAADVINMYEKAWMKNEYLFTTYVWPIGSYGGYGNESGSAKSEDSPEMTSAMKRIAYYDRNPVAKWYAENARGFEEINNEVVYEYISSYLGDLESKSPADMPLSHEFKDLGWVAMTDDLVDPNRIQLLFRSSQFGTYSHSLSDQNGFLINAFGENLAIHSGFYDAYGSPHESNFYRNSGSSNTITVANSKGQVKSEIKAKGYLTNFINHVDFDVVSGDAKEAYSTVGLGKFDRSIVYVRPDMFVVIDDLKASADDEKKSQFEWWLNAADGMSVYENKNGARIEKGAAILDATVHYPQKVKTYFNDMFAVSDMKEYVPERGYASREPHERVWFETEPVNETKMVVTMDVHKNGTVEKDVDTEYFDNYIKMTFEDGTVMLVNLKDRSEKVSAGDIEFNGDAVVYNDESIMLVSGTSLSWGGTELIKSEKIMSLAMGRDEIGISTYDDNRISVNIDNDYITKCEGITDYNGRPVTEAIGISYAKGRLTETSAETEGEPASYSVSDDEGYITFTADKSNYSLMLNGKIFKPETVTGKVKVTIDGETSEYDITGTTARDGSVKYVGTVALENRKYKVISKSKELDFGSVLEGDIRTLGNVLVNTTSSDNAIELETIESIKLNTTFDSNYDAVKANAAVFIEGEDYVGKIAEGAQVYDTRSFLSGGKGIQTFNTPGTQMNYTFEVKEAGVYDFAVKYVSWIATDSAEGTTIRSFSLNGKDYEFGVDRLTTGFGAEPSMWNAAITDSGIELQPGTYNITLEPIYGSWNYDWFAFIKR